VRQTALNAVYELAKRDPRVVFIGSDLGAGTLDDMRKEMPDRFFMEGVSEQHVIGMAAGLALEGYVPYINTIATFLTRRCFEQIALDLCLHNLPVRLIASGGGVVYAPLGPTHLAVDDLGILRTLPGMTIAAPSDAAEMKRLMDASLDVSGPLYIRLAKGGDPIVSRADLPFAIGEAVEMRAGRDALLISTGVMTARTLVAAEALGAAGMDAGVLHVHTIKPLDQQTILARARRAEVVVTVEEHSRTGGLGSAVAELVAEHGLGVRVLRLGLPDRFISSYGSQDDILRDCGLTPEGIAAAVSDYLAADGYGDSMPLRERSR
jgi:transketolase